MKPPNFIHLFSNPLTIIDIIVLILCLTLHYHDKQNLYKTADTKVQNYIEQSCFLCSYGDLRVMLYICII